MVKKPNLFAPLFRKGGPVKLSGGGAKKVVGAAKGPAPARVPSPAAGSARAAVAAAAAARK